MGLVKFDKAGFDARVFRAANRGLTVAAIEAQGHIKRGFGLGGRHTPSAPGSPPNVQRGFLRRAVTHQPSTNLRSRVGVAANAEYGAIQEFGGTIKPRQSKYLTVPVNEEAKRASERGTPIRSMRLRLAYGKMGRLLLVPDGKGRGGARKAGPVFVLKRSVTLPARPFVRPGVYKNLPAIMREARKAAAEAMR